LKKPLDSNALVDAIKRLIMAGGDKIQAKA
jgi:hypothetical protein